MARKIEVEVTKTVAEGVFTYYLLINGKQKAVIICAQPRWEMEPIFKMVLEFRTQVELTTKEGIEVMMKLLLVSEEEPEEEDTQ